MADEEADDVSEEEELASRRLTLFTKSVVASCLIHLAFFVPAFLADVRPDGEADVEIEWLESFERLEGVGHGGRWAEVGPPPKPEEEPQPPEPEEEATEPDEPEEPSEPEPPEEPPEPVKPKEVVVENAEPQPNQQPPTPRETPKPRTAREAFQTDDLPGLNRTGPNDLPSMEGYGPGNAVFTALIRLDRVRGTPFEGPTRKLLEAVPDYRIALENTGIDPVQDLDSMFMASPRPQYIQYTFLAVRHRMSDAEIQGKLDRRYKDPLRWTEYRGHPTRRLVPSGSEYRDTRRILLPGPGLGLIVRTEHLDELTEELPEDSPIAAELAERDIEVKPTLIHGLEQIERAAEAEDTIVLVSAMGARVVIPGIGRLTFDGARVEVADVTSPDLTIDLTLATEDQARRFAEGCPDLKKRIISRVPFLARNVTRMVIDRLTCDAEENYVSIRGEYTKDEADRLLNLAVPFVPRPPILNRLPPAPPPEPEPAIAPDAGNVEEPDPPVSGGIDAGQPI